MDESTVSWKQSMRDHTIKVCSCGKVQPIPYSATDGRTVIRCKKCGDPVGIISAAETKLLHRMSTIIIEYMERTHPLSTILTNHPTWRTIMTEEQPQSIHEIDSDKILRLLPGHLIFESSEARAVGESCNHRLILQPDGRSARCVLCDGLRTLDDEEVKAISAAQQAGVIFLRWENRLRAMERLQMGGSKKRRRTQEKTKKDPSLSRGVEVQVEVPAGFIPVAEAAIQLKLDPKVLRKQIRKGVYEGAKVGGRVYVRIKVE